MFLIECPNCARREASEFVWHGQDEPRPVHGERLSDDEWSDYLYGQDNPAGVVREWWFHAKGCGEWFVVQRDTRTNRVLESGFNEPSARPDIKRGMEP